MLPTKVGIELDFSGVKNITTQANEFITEGWHHCDWTLMLILKESQLLQELERRDRCTHVHPEQSLHGYLCVLSPQSIDAKRKQSDEIIEIMRIHMMNTTADRKAMHEQLVKDHEERLEERKGKQGRLISTREERVTVRAQFMQNIASAVGGISELTRRSTLSADVQNVLV